MILDSVWTLIYVISGFSCLYLVTTVKTNFWKIIWQSAGIFAFIQAFA